MHRDELHQVLADYTVLIKRADHTCSAQRTTGAIMDDVLDHALWMINCLRSGKADDKIMSDDKIMRWLCFVQGVMWTATGLSIDQAKIDNYKILNGADPS